MLRGIRGATTADDNTPESILAATHELLELIVTANDLRPDDVASAIFTTSPDLNAAYPAAAARALGWQDVALLCAHEMDVPNGLARCIRVLIHWNTSARADEVRHVYLKDAIRLRPDRPHPPAPSPNDERTVGSARGESDRLSRRAR